MRKGNKGKKPNWSLIRKQGKQTKGQFDYEGVYPKGNGWICAVGRVGELRQVLGPYPTREEAQAEAESWKQMRLSATKPVRKDITQDHSPQMSTDAFSAEPGGDSRLF
jgi:hypothetical protein